MTPTKILIGRIAIVFATAFCGMWFAAEWAAWHLGFRPWLGAPWFKFLHVPVYIPWRLFEWWYAYEA